MKYFIVFMFIFLSSGLLYGSESHLEADPEFWIEEARTRGSFHNGNSDSGLFKYIGGGMSDQRIRAIPAMCEAITRNPTELKLIVLYSLCNIPDDDDFLSKSLMKALALNNTVETLNFMNASKNTAYYLADCLEKNTGLKNCYFSENRFDDEGCLAIAQAIYKNTTLKSLTLTDCKASMKMRQVLREASAKSRSEDNKLEINF